MSGETPVVSPAAPEVEGQQVQPVAAVAVATPQPPSRLVRLRRALPETFLDLVWPTARPFTPAQLARLADRRAKRVALDQGLADALAGDPDGLSRLRGATEALIAAEDARRASVEARLTTTFGLASVATSLLLGVLSAFYDKGPPRNLAGAIVLAGLAYMLSQVVRAGTAAVAGLRRRTYPASVLKDLAPAAGESAEQHDLRVTKHLIELTSDHAELNNRKVDSMDIAHVAARNLLAGVGVVLVGLVASMFSARSAADAKWQDWEEHLKASPSVQSLLRGPPGQPGPAGETGQTGAQGPRGETGPRGVSGENAAPPHARRMRR